MEHYITPKSVKLRRGRRISKRPSRALFFGGYSRERFIYLAARTYMLIDKPKKGRGLAESLDAPITSAIKRQTP